MQRRDTRILITGHAGVRHRDVANSVVSFARQKEGWPEDYIKPYEVRLPVPVPQFLDAEELEKEKLDAWSESFETAMSRMEQENPQVKLLSMHASYYRKGRFFSLVDIDRVIDRFRPQVVITLIDDLCSIWQEVNAQRRQQDPTTYLTLADIAHWRWGELMVSDFMARKAGVPNYLVAIKHPVKMLWRLLFHPEALRVYACIPISAPRQDPTGQKVAEVNEVRRRLHQEFIVFDPVTIDDKILAFLLDNQYSGWHERQASALYGEPLHVRSSDRWPLLFEGSDDEGEKPLNSDWPDRYSFELDAGEAVEVCRARSPYHAAPIRYPSRQIQDDLVDLHIRLRDYRLIESARSLAAWRPFFEGKQPGGQVAEIAYAQHVAGKQPLDIVIYHDEERDGSLGGGPFPHIPSQYVVSAEQEMFDRLGQWARRQREDSTERRGGTS